MFAIVLKGVKYYGIYPNVKFATMMHYEYENTLIFGFRYLGVQISDSEFKLRQIIWIRLFESKLIRCSTIIQLKLNQICTKF